jgi:hypothetical protein
VNEGFLGSGRPGSRVQCLQKEGASESGRCFISPKKKKKEKIELILILPMALFEIICKNK